MLRLRRDGKRYPFPSLSGVWSVEGVQVFSIFGDGPNFDSIHLRVSGYQEMDFFCSCWKDAGFHARERAVTALAMSDACGAR